MSSPAVNPWELQAQLWKRELTPSTPFMFHHEYSDVDDKKKGSTDVSAAASGFLSPVLPDDNTFSSSPKKDDEDGSDNNSDVDNNNDPYAQQQQQENIGSRRAMLVEAGAVIDEMSPDRGSFRANKRRAQFLRQDAAKRVARQQQRAASRARKHNKSPTGSGGGSPIIGTPPRNTTQQQQQAVDVSSHGLEAVKCPYRLHAIVSQKDTQKRRRVDSHATSSSMLGMGRISHFMSDSDVAAYCGSEKTSQKLDKEPELLLSETVVAARGGLTPEESINQKTLRFVEKLANAAEREEENQLLPPPSPGSAGVTAAKTPNKHNNNTSLSFEADDENNNNTTPTPSKRRPGLAQRLLAEQESFVVDAMATIIMQKAHPPSVEEIERFKEYGANSQNLLRINEALSFVLSADDKHVFLTALRFAVSGEFYQSAAEFSRIIGFPLSDAKKVMKTLASTFDHWNRLAYYTEEFCLLKRCLAAVTETPVSWATKLHTSRSVHFGNVSQRDLEGLLMRVRNDESKKVKRVVSERHKNKML